MEPHIQCVQQHVSLAKIADVTPEVRKHNNQRGQNKSLQEDMLERQALISQSLEIYADWKCSTSN